ncbi:MAG TPA: PIG-L family deacetylase [Planctomycetota bacterium]|nr:PIG-L family deacetylase [Planctomycetota bacterium]
MNALHALLAGACALFSACAAANPESIELGTVARDAQPRILAVIAHPDDETAFAASLYVSSRHLGGRCEVFVITNGEGGFKYSGLAERLYGAPLTIEAVGRERLPDLRRYEMVQSARILGVAHLEMIGERDHRYTTDVGEVLDPQAGVWDLERVRARLDARLAACAPQFVFTLLPTEDTHGHHKAATLLALEAVARMPPDARPVVLGATVEAGGEATDYARAGLPGHPASAVVGEPLVFDRRKPLGYRGALDWHVVADWAIAAHKSQGTLSMLSGRGDREVYRVFAGGPDDAPARAAALFERLGAVELPVRAYGPSAGVVP